jgi:hypothetical protein
MKVINLDKYKPNGHKYNGNTKKFGMTINKVDYIVKYQKDGDMSVYCEYIASKFIKDIGIPCHDVALAVYQGEVVDLIKDFTSNTEYKLHSFKDTKQSSEDSSLTSKEYTYSDVTHLISTHTKMTKANKEAALRQFWNMFICDAILGNRDRHWGNWGYLCIKDNYRFAPLYDNGACLFPSVYKVIDQYINESTRQSFIYERVTKFPASLFKIKKPDRTYRSNYYEMLGNTSYSKYFKEQVDKIKNKYTVNDIYSIIKNIVMPIESLNAVYKRFFIEIVTVRYACVICRMSFKKVYVEVERRLQHEQF